MRKDAGEEPPGDLGDTSRARHARGNGPAALSSRLKWIWTPLPTPPLRMIGAKLARQPVRSQAARTIWRSLTARSAASRPGAAPHGHLELARREFRTGSFRLESCRVERGEDDLGQIADRADCLEAIGRADRGSTPNAGEFMFEGDPQTELNSSSSFVSAAKIGARAQSPRALPSSSSTSPRMKRSGADRVPEIDV